MIDKIIRHLINFALAFAYVSLNIVFNISAQPGAGIAIRINEGATYTNKTEVSVEIRSVQLAENLIEAFKISTSPNLDNKDWEPYRTGVKRTITLSSGDGTKSVYVQLRDKAGNISPVEDASIILDQTPPSNGYLRINEGAKFTNDPQRRVRLHLIIDEAAQMQIANNSNFPNTRWEPYAEVTRWILDPGGDGTRTVFARFRDAAGNISETYSASIMLDVTPPDRASVTINGGERFTNKTEVVLSIEGRNADSVFIQTPVEIRKLAFEPNAQGRMEINWTLDTVQGAKPFRVFLSDLAGNRTNTAAEASVILDTRPPAPPSITIDQGKRFTNHPQGLVNLRFTTTENPAQLRMKVSNSPDLDNVNSRSFTSTIPDWKLNDGEDGEKKVYAVLIDQAGNVSAPGEASIIHDRKAPEIAGIQIEEGRQYTNVIRVNIKADVSEAVSMQYSNSPAFPANMPWEPFAQVKEGHSLNSGDGRKVVYARFRDEAGNISEMVNDEIILDTTVPRGRLTIDQGNRFTNHPGKKVLLTMQFDDDTDKIQLGNSPDFEKLPWLDPIDEIKEWELEGEDGIKTVFMRLKDKAGNTSKPVTAQIMLDRQPPTQLSLVINDGNEWMTNRSRRVALSLRAEGARNMMISNHPEFEKATWIPFKTAVPWTLEGEEGEHVVYVRFMDEAGNISETISSSIKSDFYPPYVEKFSINQDVEYTNDPQRKVMIHLDVRDAIAMVISNQPIPDPLADNLKWEPFKPQIDWVLSNEDGLKTVYARFRDQAGNVTPEYFDKIFLDRVPPQDCKIIINQDSEWMTNPEGKVSLHISGRDIFEMKLANTSNLTAAEWIPFSSQREDWSVNVNEREVKVYGKFRDRAGNESPLIESNALKVDIVPPTNAGIAINGGEKYTNNQERKVQVSITVDGADFMHIGFTKTQNIQSWETVAGEKEITLPPGEGEKEIFAIFRDKAGNLSNWVSASVILDLTPPRIEQFTINQGELWTNDPLKKVSLQVKTSGASELMIGFDKNFNDARWLPFQEEINDVILPGDDGEKRVFLRLRDEAGNISEPAEASINLKRSF
ncbi:MAG: hypothetical protein JJU28_23610 [Cyclobacteriaceae bacterium]|nr:hypothetical protein [Cyclobacteriaceae bacterium]